MDVYALRIGELLRSMEEKLKDIPYIQPAELVMYRRDERSQNLAGMREILVDTGGSLSRKDGYTQGHDMN